MLDTATLGLILIVLGIILIAATAAGGKIAVVGFIGPVPIGFGNDPKLLLAALVAGSVIFILLLLFFLRGIL